MELLQMIPHGHLIHYMISLLVAGTQLTVLKVYIQGFTTIFYLSPHFLTIPYRYF